MNSRHPLRHVLRANDERVWSDLLAALIESDPETLCTLVDEKLVGTLDCEPQASRSRVETGSGARDQVDILVTDTNEGSCIIEVKVLSPLELSQLERYAQTYEKASERLVITLRSAQVTGSPTPGWRHFTWEDVLSLFAKSKSSWVSETATQWRALILDTVPNVDEFTVWKDIAIGQDFRIAMRARMVWLMNHLLVSPPATTKIGQSSRGVSTSLTMKIPSKSIGYEIWADVEEYLSSESWPGVVSIESNESKGPSIKVLLVQNNVESSKAFDWSLLARMWPEMESFRGVDWVVNVPRPRSDHDKQGIELLRAVGCPRFLGIGYGEAEADNSGFCGFGARLQLSPELTLENVKSILAEIESLLHLLALVE